MPLNEGDALSPIPYDFVLLSYNHRLLKESFFELVIFGL